MNGESGRTHRFHTTLYSFFQHKALAGMDDIDNRAWTDRFEIFKEDSGVSSIC